MKRTRDPPMPDMGGRAATAPPVAMVTRRAGESSNESRPPYPSRRSSKRTGSSTLDHEQTDSAMSSKPHANSGSRLQNPNWQPQKPQVPRTEPVPELAFLSANKTQRVNHKFREIMPYVYPPGWNNGNEDASEVALTRNETIAISYPVVPKRNPTRTKCEDSSQAAPQHQYEYAPARFYDAYNAPLQRTTTQQSSDSGSITSIESATQVDHSRPEPHAPELSPVVESPGRTPVKYPDLTRHQSGLSPSRPSPYYRPDLRRTCVNDEELRTRAQGATSKPLPSHTRSSSQYNLPPGKLLSPGSRSSTTSRTHSPGYGKTRVYDTDASSVSSNTSTLAARRGYEPAPLTQPKSKPRDRSKWQVVGDGSPGKSGTPQQAVWSPPPRTLTPKRVGNDMILNFDHV